MREMKDSGMPWIGKIPKDWKTDKFKYHLKRSEPRNPGNQVVLSLYRDYGIIPKDSRDDNHNVTSEDTSNYKYVQIGDFVVNKMKAWQGSVAVSNYEGIVSPAYYVYKFSDHQIYKKYLHYLLRACYKDEFMRLSGGLRVGQWDLSADGLGNTYILIPPYDEQVKIADYLDSKKEKIDSIREGVEAEIEALKQYKKSVVTEAVTKGLDKDVEMKDSGSQYWGEIPQSWNIVDIKYLFQIMKRIAGREGYDVLSITQHGIKVRDVTIIKGQLANDYSNYQLLYPGEFAMNHMDLLTGWVDLSDKFGVTSPDYRVFRLRDTVHNSCRYYKYVMQVCYMCRIFYSLGSGVANLGRWRLQTPAFNNFKVPVPSYEEQEAIANYLDNKIAKIDSIIQNKQELFANLDTYKKSLIYECVTGKKEVPAV